MPDQNQPKAPAFNPKLKDAIVALKAENNPKNPQCRSQRAGALSAAGTGQL